MTREKALTAEMIEAYVLELRDEVKSLRRHVYMMLGGLVVVGSLAFLLPQVLGVKGQPGVRGETGAAGPGTEIGSIVVWADDEPPASGDWRICDGTTVEWGDEADQAACAELWSVLRNRYGNGNQDQPEEIKLPDYRGYFLRGADIPTSGPMAETAQRSAQTKREVGTYQSDDVGLLAQIREQEISGFDDYAMLWGDGTRAQQVVRDGPPRFEYLPVTAGFAEFEKHRENNWGFETRPVNAAVNFIIRVK